MFIFQEIEASGILLCYGPLALTIIGFIAFAYLTDNISTRTYLRNLDPRPEAEIKESQAIAVKRSTRAITPTGASVTMMPTEEVPVAAAAPSVEPVAPPAPPPQPDDLRRIEGIGPKIKSVLNQVGITTFSQLAAMTPTEIREVLSKAGMSGVNDPTTWPEQATLAAQGKWDELKNLQDQLRGGKRV